MATAHTLVSPYPPHPQSQSNNVQSMTGDFRLPSIKDLNFPTQPPPQDGTPAQNPSEHSSLQAAHQARHQHPAWSRNPQAANNAPSQHASAMPPPPDPVKQAHKPSRKPSDGGYPPSAMHYQSDSSQGPNGAVGGHPRSNSQSHSSSKRGRSGSTVGAPPGRSSHPNTPTHPQQPPPPPSSYHSGPPPQTQGSPQQPHQPQGYPAPSAPYPYPPHMPPRYPVQPPAAQPPAQHQHQHQPPPSNSYPPPPAPHEHWQHQPAPPPAQAPYDNYIRTTPIVPATVDTRNAPPPQAGEPERGSKDTIISEIVQHCNTLWSFANQYVQGQPQYQPPPDELRKMTQFASAVVRLLEELKRLTSPDNHAPQSAYAEDARAPKRPWEDMSREEELAGQSESTAEQDMEIIRSKRATSSGANTPGQPKSKYRKRSRATPPGKCHSCNIRETPEWRRGPDGARTLCNACGLHYAKLMRKREKVLGADGKPMPIDLQTLRASTASARGSGAEGGEHLPGPPPGQGPPHHSGSGPPPGYDGQQPMHPPPPHGSPYQLIPVSAQSQQPPPPHNAHQMMPPPPPPQNQEHSIPGQVPPPPWASTNRYPPDQSYIRPPPHTRSPQ
ncbi:hypothetical protein BC629DRAFT_1678240 [Irpex lacteus]|nr:hypothetical protein BC629DRAFT_1678240 [Irpex lacteus]